jgi:4-hydroxy-tetrahydrodipicolinate reductase
VNAWQCIVKNLHWHPNILIDTLKKDPSVSIKVGVLGAFGRMGQAIVTVLAEHNVAVLSAAGEYAGHAKLGQDIGGVQLTSDVDEVMQASDVVIDFTTAAALRPHLDSALAHKTPFVVGTTGQHDKYHCFIVPI